MTFSLLGVLTDGTPPKVRLASLYFHPSSLSSFGPTSPLTKPHFIADTNGRKSGGLQRQYQIGLIDTARHSHPVYNRAHTCHSYQTFSANQSDLNLDQLEHDLSIILPEAKLSNRNSSTALIQYNGKHGRRKYHSSRRSKRRHP
jgi:hypothetical protein